MAVTFVIRFEVNPDRVEEFKTLLNGVLDAMRHEATFHDAILLRDPTSETRFLLYETWETLEDVLQVQVHRPYREQWHAALPHLLAKPRDIETWEPLRADRRAQ